MAWSTIIRWKEHDDGLVAELSWAVPATVASGTYRIKHSGNYRLTVDKLTPFETTSPEFKVED